VHSVKVALLGEILVAGSVAAITTPLASSSAAMFAAMEHLVLASGTVAVASEIGGTTFALASAFGSSMVT
jgi:hypothetical protein